MDFGVIGYGYWGPNIVRNLVSLEGAEVRAIADVNSAAQARARKAYPGVKVTPSAKEVISSPDVDAVAIISPVWTHYELTKAALQNGKHVFVEKPFTSTAAQGEELVNLAQQKNLKLMVDHTFLFTGAVKRIAQLIDEGTLGICTTTTPRGSISAYFSTISMCSGTSRHMTFRSWTISSRPARKPS